MAEFSFKHYVEQKLGRFPRFIIYALLEWALMLVLFVDGFIAFFANEFARFFEMPIPCLLCTRIDHVLVRRNADFYYNDSICESHKKDASFLAYCHVHRKLSDIRKMCEHCLLSFATEKESDCDTYKSLVGILHKDLECFVEDENKLNLKVQLGKKEEGVEVERSGERCSCCGEPLKIKSSVGNGGPTMNRAAMAPTSTPRASFLMLKKEGNQYENDSDEDNLNGLIAAGKEDAKVPLLSESEYLNEDPLKTPKFLTEDTLKTPKFFNDESCKTPNSFRGNKFFGIPLTDSATSSPRWAYRPQRKSPLEKSELGSESAEGIASNEIDPDSILLRLKRQVRLDRKSLISLYMELDEERSASAVAANNAMAMITRLQAEKAAVQMEALQYQRMMEEQAEYDQEALQVLKGMLSKREEEIKDLETKFGTSRENYSCEGEDGGENSECGSPTLSSNERENGEGNRHDSDGAGLLQVEKGRGIHEESISDFECERSSLVDRSKDQGDNIQLPADEVHSPQ